MKEHIDPADHVGHTALHLTVHAVMSVEGAEEVAASVEVVRILLEHGASAAARGSKGETPLDLLRRHPSLQGSSAPPWLRSGLELKSDP